jgi:hypothetical protein
VIGSAATFFARAARTGRGAGVLCTAATGEETIGAAEDGSAGSVEAATFLATFLTAVLVATFLAAFLATRLGFGAASPAVLPSWLLLLIRNQLKGRCAARIQTVGMRVEREFLLATLI